MQTCHPMTFLFIHDQSSPCLPEQRYEGRGQKW